MNNYYVSYQDKKGAGITKYFSDEVPLCKFLSRLKRDAIIGNSENGEIVGNVFWDETKKCWNWIYDPELQPGGEMEKRNDNHNNL